MCAMPVVAIESGLCLLAPADPGLSLTPPTEGVFREERDDPGRECVEFSRDRPTRGGVSGQGGHTTRGSSVLMFSRDLCGVFYDFVRFEMC